MKQQKLSPRTIEKLTIVAACNSAGAKLAASLASGTLSAANAAMIAAARNELGAAVAELRKQQLAQSVN